MKGAYKLWIAQRNVIKFLKKDVEKSQLDSYFLESRSK